jgi:aminopeptidase-like protein
MDSPASSLSPNNLALDATSVEVSAVGQAMHQLMGELFPICRSITGNGVRQSLGMIKGHIPLELREVPSGTRVFDWTIPKEWNIRRAYIRDAQGKEVIDFQRSNLHVLNYSLPVHKTVPLKELKEHLYTVPEHPDWIPYRTSYYKENWGFCLSHNQLQGLSDGDYEVMIDASLETGSLTYGECYLRGESDEEVLISAHICHPALANDNLSGVALAVFLAKSLSGLSLKYSYRFLFIPGTIGSITWLSLNEAQVFRVKHGIVLTCVGDPGKFTYKKSRRGDAAIDRAVHQALKSTGHPFEIREFSPYGYDERQFCSPGFNLPVGCLMRTPHGQFPEYHTSADNLDLVRPEYLADSFAMCRAVFEILEHNRVYLNQNPKCEPQLGKRGIYSPIGGQAEGRLHELAMLWVLNLSDGENSLLDIAERSNLGFTLVYNAARVLLKHGLLQESPENSPRRREPLR